MEPQANSVVKAWVGNKRTLGFGAFFRHAFRRYLPQIALCIIAASFALGASGNGIVSARAEISESTVFPIAGFASGDRTGWEERSFKGRTQYSFARIEGRGGIQAESRGTASYLIRTVNVDLTRTPFLNWSWRAGNRLTGLDEQTRAGDDYVARIYVVFSGVPFFWQTRALNYVWSSNQPPGTVWPSALTDRSMMFALRSGEDVGRWMEEKRNIREDYRAVFGKDIEAVSAVAIMTDTDQSGRTARAWFGDLVFTAQ